MVRRTFLAASIACFALSCSPPEPPTITVKEAKLTHIDLTGMKLSLRVLATNKNRFELTLSSFEGKLLLNGRDAGVVSLVQPVTLATGEKTPLDVPLALTWNDLGTIAVAATSGRDVPFVVDGTVGVGGGKLSVRIPMKTEGTLSKRDIAEVMQKSVPKLPFTLPK
jgi:LEA14-like dessication related protein